MTTSRWNKFWRIWLYTASKTQKCLMWGKLVSDVVHPVNEQVHFSLISYLQNAPSLYPSLYLLSFPISLCVPLNTLRTGDADLRFYVTTVQDGWRRFAFLTRWNSVHLPVLLSATPQGGMFPEVSHPQALLGSLLSISWKFHFTKIVSEFLINF